MIVVQELIDRLVTNPSDGSEMFAGRMAFKMQSPWSRRNMEAFQIENIVWKVPSGVLNIPQSPQKQVSV